jgi:DNA-binding NarL/FixJ family response regulator
MYTDETLVRQALRDGVNGYLPKSASRDDLLLAVRAASKDETYLSPAVSQPVVDGFLTLLAGDEPDCPAERLTLREREVLQLIAEGYTNRAVARALQISVKTVEKHRASTMEKLGTRNLAELIRAGNRHGLVLLQP